MKLFDQVVVPILTYGCEVWGFENLGIIEKLHLQFCKLVLQVKKSTPNCMVYGELGRQPIDVIVKGRMLAYWARLLTGPPHKYAHLMYNLCLQLHTSGKIVFPWLQHVQNTLNELGFSNVWINQNFPNTNWLINSVLSLN